MKVISIKKEYILVVFYVMIIIFGLYKNYGTQSVPTFSMPTSKKVIVIDAGHGGWDPGKVGTNGILEKDINLEIAQKLQMFLEQSGATVIMTRTDDNALGDTKNTDLKKRRDLVNKNKADILISIHQNSYTDDSVKGAQSFYFGDSDQSKNLAQYIQKEISSSVDTSNKRQAMANSNYYVLKQTDSPAVLIECGFLTNPVEQKNLQNDDYQEKLAWAIYKGTVDYLNSSGK